MAKIAYIYWHRKFRITTEVLSSVILVYELWPDRDTSRRAVAEPTWVVMITTHPGCQAICSHWYRPGGEADGVIRCAGPGVKPHVWSWGGQGSVMWTALVRPPCCPPSLAARPPQTTPSTSLAGPMPWISTRRRTGHYNGHDNKVMIPYWLPRLNSPSLV